MVRQLDQRRINTSDLFDYIIKKRLQPGSDTALFIFTSLDLYNAESDFIYGHTRVSLRITIQSVFRHANPISPIKVSCPS